MRLGIHAVRADHPGNRSGAAGPATAVIARRTRQLIDFCISHWSAQFLVGNSHSDRVFRAGPLLFLIVVKPLEVSRRSVYRVLVARHASSQRWVIISPGHHFSNLPSRSIVIGRCRRYRRYRQYVCSSRPLMIPVVFMEVFMILAMTIPVVYMVPFMTPVMMRVISDRHFRKTMETTH